MDSIERYISQEVEKPFYSETRWAISSNAVAAVINVDWTPENPVLILYRSVWINFTGVNTASLKDNMDRLIFHFDANIAASTSVGIFEINHVVKAKRAKLTLTCDIARVFSVGYQLIMNSR